MAYEYYSILGVEKNATADEIKKAYRKKAMEHHPDRHNGDKSKEAEFKKINEAYAVLSDDQKKAHYDRFGTMEWHGMWGWFQGGGMPFDFGDIFESFFWGGFSASGQARRQVGEDIEVKLDVTFGEAILGTKKELKFRRQSVCQDCHGTGAKAGSAMETCPDCHGNGRVRQRSQTVFGVMEQIVACPRCGGNGKIIKEACSTCHGKKFVTETVNKEIDVPAGIDDGMTIKIRGEGHSARDGAGDLYVHFRVPESEGNLTRDDAHLIYTLHLDPVEFVLGTKKEIEIPILGTRPVEIKPGTEVWSELVFRGEGVPNVSRSHAQKGNLVIRLEINIPKKLTKKEKELYEEIAKERGLGKHDEKGIFGKLFD